MCYVYHHIETSIIVTSRSPDSRGAPASQRGDLLIARADRLVEAALVLFELLVDGALLVLGSVLRQARRLGKGRWSMRTRSQEPHGGKVQGLVHVGLRQRCACVRVRACIVRACV